MRKMYRILAVRTRSDERALRYGFTAVALSVAVTMLLAKLWS
jgi:hypothetical protein